MDAGRGLASGSETALLAGVRAAVVRHQLLAPRDRILVAVSGGPDSVALLHALTRLRPEYGLDLGVCHVHHGLRVEADRDAEFVRSLAARLDCPVAVERVTVPHGSGQSAEAAARAARYAALQRQLRATGATRLAVGHTADDQAETVLMRVLEGAGPRGLAGIPVRRGRLIRPLLEVHRTTVLAHLAAFDLPFVEDATNRDPRILRNRIRHELLPLLAAHGWPRIAAALRRVALASRETVEALDALLAPCAGSLVTPDPAGWRIELAPLQSLPPGAAKALFRLAIAEVAPAQLRAGLRAHHLTALADLLASPVGARVRLPGGLVVERAREALWVGSLHDPVSAGRVMGKTPLAVPGETAVRAARLRLTAEVEAPTQGYRADSPWEACFDADALPATLEVRPIRRGDRILPYGAARPVRVVGLLGRAGVPRPARERWPLLVGRDGSGEEILWVIGVRRGGAAPVRPGTTSVLRVRAALDPSEAEREEAT